MSLTKAYARIEELEQENAQLRLQIDMYMFADVIEDQMTIDEYLELLGR